MHLNICSRRKMQTFFANMDLMLQESLASRFVNNIHTDQPAHQHSLFSAFIIHSFERIITKGICALKEIWPPLEPKIENCFMPIFFIGLLEE